MMETINFKFKELLEDESNYRLNEISNIKDYFNEEIQYQQSLTNKLNKYWTVFDYSNKILTVVLTVFQGLIFLVMLRINNFRSNDFCIFLVILFVFWNNYKTATRNKVKEEDNKSLFIAKNKLD